MSNLTASRTSARQKYSFSSDDEVTWTLDGEFGGALHNVQITNCSRAITFATGKEPEGKES